MFPNDNIFLIINNKMSYSNILGTRTSIYLRRVPKIIKITLITMILPLQTLHNYLIIGKWLRFRNSFESLPVSFLSHVYVGIPLVFEILGIKAFISENENPDLWINTIIIEFEVQMTEMFKQVPNKCLGPKLWSIMT